MTGNDDVTQHQQEQSVPATEGSPEAAAESTEQQAQADEPAAADVAALERELAAKESQLEELRSQYLRLRADFDNYRRRVRQEMADLTARAAEKLISNMLPVLDNLDRAITAAKQRGTDNSLLEGVMLVQKGLLDILAAEGLEELPGKGSEFDPNIHEAVDRAGDGDGKLVVVEEYMKGYRLAGRVLRPTMVKVGPAEESAQA